MTEDNLNMAEADEIFEALKNSVLNDDVDEILQSCKVFIKYHIADVNKFMSK